MELGTLGGYSGRGGVPGSQRGSVALGGRKERNSTARMAALVWHGVMFALSSNCIKVFLRLADLDV